MKPETPKSPLSTSTKVEEVLKEKPLTLDPDDSVQAAADRMREMQAGEWPVAREKELLGMMDQRDPDRKVAGFGHDPKKIPVGQNMSRDVLYCYEDQTCGEALAVMDARKLSYLPVVDRQQRISGIVSREELMTACGDPAETKDGG